MNILQDLKTAARVFTKVRKARKNGTSGVKIDVKPVHVVPIIAFKPCYHNTIEGCLGHRLRRDTDKAVMKVFDNLPYETQRRLEFAPKEPREWMDRARFWRRELEPELPQDMYHEVMMVYLSWYAHCLRMGKTAHKITDQARPRSN